MLASTRNACLADLGRARSTCLLARATARAAGDAVTAAEKTAQLDLIDDAIARVAARSIHAPTQLGIAANHAPRHGLGVLPKALPHGSRYSLTRGV